MNFRMKIKLTSVSIDDYDKALKFYTDVMGFVKKRDIPLGDGARWLTVVSPEEPDGVELQLRIALQLAGDQEAGRAGADDQHARVARRPVLPR